jgi:formylglycine-generating enzyme required for sulfatase activity
MRVFVSYSSEDRKLVEPVYLALRAQGHRVFFDRAELPPGEEYDVRIRRAIEKSRLFIFMVSPTSLDAGSYTLTELAIAQKIWDHPGGRLLPVLLRPVDLRQVPAYLKALTLLEPEGNVAAGVADAVHRIALARRRARLKSIAIAVAAASVVLFGAYTWIKPGARLETAGRDGAPAVVVAAGHFTMGDAEDSPPREVYLSGFFIDKYEVTVSRYAKFLETTGGVKPPDHWEEARRDSAAELPVIGVDWHDADAYCRWAGKRLPSEAEWEKAARGADGRRYPWGNDEPAAERANFGKSSSASVYQGGLTAVSGREAGQSPYGAEDLAGNASEWVADWYAEGFARGDVRNPKGPASGTGKVIRGGGWYDPPDRLKSSRRMYASPDNRAEDVGFRCAADLA